MATVRSDTLQLVHEALTNNNINNDVSIHDLNRSRYNNNNSRDNSRDSLSRSRDQSNSSEYGSGRISIDSEGPGVQRFGYDLDLSETLESRRSREHEEYSRDIDIDSVY